LPVEVIERLLAFIYPRPDALIPAALFPLVFMSLIFPNNSMTAPDPPLLHAKITPQPNESVAAKTACP